jgi:hypothetical protein
MDEACRSVSHNYQEEFEHDSGLSTCYPVDTTTECTVHCRRLNQTLQRQKKPYQGSPSMLIEKPARVPGHVIWPNWRGLCVETPKEPYHA